MKKIFTLLFSMGVFASSFAQPGHQNNNKRNDQYVTNTQYKKINSNRDKLYTFSSKEKDKQIAKINNDFSFKVKSIISNRYIIKNQKGILIQKAQVQEEKQVEAVNAKFNSKYNTAFNDHVNHPDNYKH